MKTGRKPGPVPTTQCKQCGKTFEYKRYGTGNKWHYDRTQEFCTKKCADDFQTKGWGIDKHGYRVQNRSNGTRRVYQFEHRVVMEQHLARPLRKDETVHHVNGNRLDNRIENLELWSSRHGKGQRVEDKIKFCREFLADYDPKPDLWPILVSILEPRRAQPPI